MSLARVPLPSIRPEVDVAGNHYWQYHALDALLACKRPMTASQDEDLFITVHQVCELAFHQMILDLQRTLDAFAQALNAPPPALLDGAAAGEAAYFLQRVLRLYDTVLGVVPVLGSLRGFAEFRQAIGPGSGFQSAQFRQLEIMSGVRRPYWQGGTRDASGTPHVAETEFERRHGAAVAAWFERYRGHNLRVLSDRLAARAPGASQAERRAALAADAHAGPLVDLLAAYDAAQLRFHRVHLALAVQQLARVGVTHGTGGTLFRDYLGTYEREQAPLFASLAEGEGAPSP